MGRWRRGNAGSNRRAAYAALSVILLAAVFILDIIIPPGYSVWLLNLLPLSFAFLSGYTTLLLIEPLLATIFIAVSSYPVFGGFPSSMIFVNRIAGSMLVWAAAFFFIIFGRRNDMLRRNEHESRELAAQLQAEVEERRAVEESLRRSANELREIVETANSVILRLDKQGHIVFMNNFGLRFFGYEPRELSALKVTDLMPLESRNDAEALVQSIIARPEAYTHMEVENVRSNGERVWLTWSNRALRDEQGKVLEVLSIGNDITQLKKTEQELRRREKETRTLAENSPDIIARFDRDLRYTYINTAGALLLHKTSAEILGKTSLELGGDPSQAEFLESSMRRIFQKGEPQEIEFRPVCPDGQEYYFSVRMVPEFENDKVVSLLSLSRDISGLKDIQKKLSDALRQMRKRTAEAEEGERVLNALMEYVPEGILIVDAPDGRIRMISSYLSEVTGISAKDAEGKQAEFVDEKLLIPENSLRESEQSGNERPLSRVLKEGKAVVGMERNLVLPDGKTMVVLINASPLKDGQGKVVGAVSIWRDITDRKTAEETLRQSEYQVRTLVDNSPDLIMRFDCEGRYTYVNPAFEKLTGISREKCLGKFNSDLGMPHEQSALWEKVFGEICETKQARSFEFSFSGLFGVRFLWGRAIPEFDGKGSGESVIVIARDITERKQAEEHIRYISFHDKVTGLYNRAFFEEEIQRIDNERELPISILMGDVNNLKLMNDIYGHPEGDKLLRKIAEILQESCRKNDIIARWGGDEFVVILPKADRATAEKIAHRIDGECQGAGGPALPPSIAVGVSCKARKDQNIFRILRDAEEKMYRNKAFRVKENQELIISHLCATLFRQTPEVEKHMDRVVALLGTIAPVFELSGKDLEDLTLIAQLHELGKVSIPGEIWMKQGKLLPHEWLVMKKHSEVSFRIARAFSNYSRVADILLGLEERWDGSGYPKGLRETEIPYLSRLFAIIDAYDVMTHPRVYDATLSREEAAAELAHHGGTQFDPHLVSRFVQLLRKDMRVTAGMR